MIQIHAQPGYAGEWTKTRLYGHSYDSGDFTDEQYDWIRDHFEYFTIEKTHMRSIYGNPSHEQTSKICATKLIEANPNCKPLTIYSIGSGYPLLFESEAEILISNPEYFTYDEDGEVDELSVTDSGENDWYVETVNSNVDDSDLYGTFLDGYKETYTNYTENVQYMSDRITGFRLVNGMDFTPNGLTIRGWPECLNYSDGVFIDSFFRRRVMSKDAGVVLLDACIAIPDDQMFVCFSAYDGYSSTYEFSHAAYLIVANDNAYYRWVNEGDNLWSTESLMTWYDVFDKEMGEPLGKAVKDGYVYTRVFEHCTVTLDVENITSSIIWNEDNVLGVSKLPLEENTFLIYPNPVKDMVTFELGTTESAQYKIINIAGQVILSGTINNGSASVDLSSLASGNYTVAISNDSITETKKIIKE
jgi:hypothetical protein